MLMDQEMQESREPKLPVKMIADRDLVRDQIYKTGDWQRGEVKLVPESVQRKLIAHVDTYANVSTEEAAKANAKAVTKTLTQSEKEIEAQKVQELMDQIALMNRDDAVEYANVHYGTKLAGNISAENARKELVSLVDRFGPQ